MTGVVAVVLFVFGLAAGVALASFVFFRPRGSVVLIHLDEAHVKTLADAARLDLRESDAFEPEDAVYLDALRAFLEATGEL